MEIWYEVAGTVVVDTVTGERLSSQLFPDKHLVVTFRGCTGTIQPAMGDKVTGVRQLRYANVFKTILK